MSDVLLAQSTMNHGGHGGHSGHTMPSAQGADEAAPKADQKADESSQADDGDPAVRVRVGRHAGFSRVVFDWPTRVPYRVEHQGQTVTIHFERAASLDLTRFRKGRLPFVKSITPRRHGDGLAVEIEVSEGARVRSFAPDDRVVIDVRAPANASMAKRAAPANTATASKPRVAAAEDGMSGAAHGGHDMSAGQAAPKTQVAAAKPGMAGAPHGDHDKSTKQAMNHGEGQMEMGHGMGHQMGPDSAPPVGVMGGMSPPNGRFMLSLRYMHMRMDGNRDGTDSLSKSDVLDDFMVAPLDMTMDMIMLGGMYGITDDITATLMIPYIRKEMNHETRMGVEFDTKSQGLGDVQIGGGYRLFNRGGQELQVNLGLSLPTGSIDEIDDTPAADDTVLPYPMQIGSGTFDLVPSLVYEGRVDGFSWGAQAGATVRLGENSENYTLGNIYRGSVWGSYRWLDWVSNSVRLQGEIEENIDGEDERLNPMMVPTADPDLRGGERLEVGLGVNFMVPSGPLQGLGLSVEGLIPVYQDLDGPQLERDWSIVAGVRKMF